MAETAALDRVREALERAGSTLIGKHPQFKAKCPAHEDSNPSLGVLNGATRVNLRCHAGCDSDDVREALGLTVSDLYHQAKGRDHLAVYQYPGVTVRRTQDKQFFRKGATTTWPLYRAELLPAAVANGQTVYLVEGEEDVHAAEAVGAVATTSGPAGSIGKADLEPLRGAKVILVPDRDVPGRAWQAQATRLLTGLAADVKTSLPAEGKDLCDHLAAGNTLDQLVPWVGEQREDDIDAGPQPIDWHDLFARDPDAEPEWLLEPLIEVGRSTALYSPPKAGKSLLALEAVAAIAAGKAALGNAPRTPRPVVYFDFENSEADLHERLVDLGYGADDLTHLHYYSFPRIEFFDTEIGGRQALALALRHDAVLVVIDTLSRTIVGEENAADTYARYYRCTGMPLKAAGMAVFRLDHAGKDPELGQRGSSAKSADVDYVWRLTDHGNDRISLRREATRTTHGADHMNITRRVAGDGLPLRHLIEGHGFVSGNVERIARELDRLGVPADAGRPAAKAALRAAQVGAKDADLALAIKYRKEQAVSEPIPDPVDNPSGNCSLAEGTPDIRSTESEVFPRAGNTREQLDVTAGQGEGTGQGTPGNTEPHGDGAQVFPPPPLLRREHMGPAQPEQAPNGSLDQDPQTLDLDPTPPVSSEPSTSVCAVCQAPISLDRWYAGKRTCAEHYRQEPAA